MGSGGDGRRGEIESFEEEQMTQVMRSRNLGFRKQIEDISFESSSFGEIATYTRSPIPPDEDHLSLFFSLTSWLRVETRSLKRGDTYATVLLLVPDCHATRHLFVPLRCMWFSLKKGLLINEFKVRVKPSKAICGRLSPGLPGITRYLSMIWNAVLNYIMSGVSTPTPINSVSGGSNRASKVSYTATVEVREQGRHLIVGARGRRGGKADFLPQLTSAHHPHATFSSHKMPSDGQVLQIPSLRHAAMSENATPQLRYRCRGYENLAMSTSFPRLTSSPPATLLTCFIEEIENDASVRLLLRLMSKLFVSLAIVAVGIESHCGLRSLTLSPVPRYSIHLKQPAQALFKHVI